MNRALKFRLWDKKHEAWEDAQYMAIALDGTIMLGAHHSVEPERYVIMQFTGLLDKHGKEVYEGDIVRGEVRGAYFSVLERRVVEYTEDMGLSPFHDIPDYECEQWMDVLVDGFEILGNIYEHPELLNAD